ncbi:hypothetical protein CO662_33620 [Rhizobium anhuiense]|uniref:Uncharacterized protein n=1 Tax=Rhizobium anhuiense TaxID=1184720 RepID=A0A3S0QER2_9HYPH|nr:hypothetical protein [Rhizobium anhuiense]PDS34039.1 hypothetical protein CO665_32705 [Rhizobium anhuiense]PDS40820.1 hypothetical protein CO668_32275 [Rhizobium anhuiense]PDS47703.1 hypothetical protein CO662_33620 [Rhizobium anhuiense]PDS55555.1 hypothetical protein CO663_29945 [Rhizobium anhuiense]
MVRPRFVMQKQAVVFNGQEVGIAVPVENRLKFIAVRFNVIDLDNRLFDTVTEIRRAITEHLASSGRAITSH